MRRLGQQIIGGPVPRCEDTGEFKAVQCIGSVCYCTDVGGSQIVGYKFLIHQFNPNNCSKLQFLIMTFIYLKFGI